MPNSGKRKNKRVAIAEPPPPPKQPAAVASDPGPNAIGRWFEAAESWLVAHVGSVVCCIVAAGLYLRFVTAGGTYFHSDEAWILLTAMKSGLGNVYRAGLVHNYGPLMNFALHFLTFFGGSERYFRMPGILAGALTPMVAYRWVADTFGKGAGLAAACILGFSPELVILSAQVRHYAVHTFFIVCSMYCLERAFRERSAKWMRLFGAALLLALLTMYMSAWFTAAAGVYALVRILRKELPWRLAAEWAAIQVAAAGLMAVAWATHLRGLVGSPAELYARQNWLRASYYHPESQGPFDFLSAATGRLFGFVFANARVGTWMVFVFLAGIGLILWGKAGMPGRRRIPALSLVLPFVVTAAAGLLAVYPYGGTRHDSFLCVFMAAGASVAVSFAAQGRLVVVLPAAMCLIPLWIGAAEPHVLDDLPSLSTHQQMAGMLDYLPARTPPVRTVVVDLYSAPAFNYYVCRGTTGESQRLGPYLSTCRCADYQILTLETWAPPLRAYAGSLTAARAITPNLFPDPAWVFYISLTPWTTENHRGVKDGTFGKLELHRLSP